MGKRKPYLALLLSILTPGLGHIYCRKPLKGILLYCCATLYFPFVFLMGIVPEKGTFYYCSFLAVVLFSAMVMLYAIVDVFFLARRQPDGMHPGQLNRLWVYSLILLVGLATAYGFPVIIKSKHVQAFKIPSSAMLPNVLIGDYLFSDKALYKKRLPRRGEIVVFIYPKDRRKYFIKRVIGLPGDQVEVRGEEVILNGRSLVHGPKSMAEFNGTKGRIKGVVVTETLGNSTYSILFTESQKSKDHSGPFLVPEGHCFVLGDNRFNSFDSRNFGTIPLDDVLARADFIYLPAGSWSHFGKI